MRQILRKWVADSDTRENIRAFDLQSQSSILGYQAGRANDLYFSLTDELFDCLREEPEDPRDWATLGNALAQLGRTFVGVKRSDAMFFSATAFYSGGYSASAYLTMQEADPQDWTLEAYRACYDLLARPDQLISEQVTALVDALRDGRLEEIERAVVDANEAAKEAREQGPEKWVACHVYASLLERFDRVNLRAILPQGGSPRWNPLIESFLDRTPPVWDFFPSQISTIREGLLESDSTYSLQMPTGAGKTALAETLIFSHLTRNPDDVAVLLVPFRALARELRSSLAKRLSSVGLPTKTIYGGTVPTRDESLNLDSVRVVIATPEALTGVLSRSPELASRLSLAICDEGHLLGQESRGVGLELLLARLRGRDDVRLRVVFISAIIPNIEEINAWLGGSDSTVVKSTFRPAEAEYATLRSVGNGRNMTVSLEMQPILTTLQAHALPDFLQASDFEYRNSTTRRRRTHSYSSVKAQAIATARKSLKLGSVAVFTPTKTGNQGVLRLADELLTQIELELPLPGPYDYVSRPDLVREVGDYLEREYGADWIGTRALMSGAVIHHGDIPQETREALEELVSREHVRMLLCTGTLAEGVNLPIRTLILNSVKRRSAEGRSTPLLARDIRNLVGRAGRAGLSTKALIICANSNEWDQVRPVAADIPGENVNGALRDLIAMLQEDLRRNGLSLTNESLENYPDLYPLVDGIDATLIELLHDEVGDEQFRGIAASLAVGTFASQQIDSEGQDILIEVFTLRAGRMTELRESGKLPWIRDTGTKARLLDSVTSVLVPSFDNWETIDSPLDNQLLESVLTWAYSQSDFVHVLRKEYRVSEAPPVGELMRLVRAWVAGYDFSNIAQELNYDIDTLLRIHGKVVVHSLTTLVEQGVAILERYLSDTERPLSDTVVHLPDYLRFGVATPAARTMMASGVRHRRAAVFLGDAPAMTARANTSDHPNSIAWELLQDGDHWRAVLGDFVYTRTRSDVT